MTHSSFRRRFLFTELRLRNFVKNSNLLVPLQVTERSHVNGTIADAQVVDDHAGRLDEEPPFAIGTQYNYDPSSANPLGRVFAVAVKKRF